MLIKYQSKKECLLCLEWQKDDGAGFPGPQHTFCVPTYLWHTKRSSSSVFSHYYAVHTPVLHQRVEDSAK